MYANVLHYGLEEKIPIRVLFNKSIGIFSQSKVSRWLIKRKARLRIRGQASKRNIKKKIFLRRFLLSADFWQNL